MRKFLCAALAAMWVLGMGSMARAQTEMKPLVVLSLSGYDEIHGDLEMLGKLSDNPELAQDLDGLLMMFTQGQGLNGLDGTRPWGAAVMTDGALQPSISIFLPVNDLDKLLGALGGLNIAPKDVGDDVKLIRTGLMDMYVKAENGWAFIAQSPEGLMDPPADPAAMLDGLNGTYDLALRIYVRNVPEIFRSMAVDQIKNGMRTGMQKMPGESEEQFQFRNGLAKAQLDQMTNAINDIDQVTPGFSLDAAEKHALLDMNMSLVAGSPSAEKLKSTEKKSSLLAGFTKGESVAFAHFNSAVGEADKAQLAAAMAQVRTQVMSEIGKDHDLPNEEVKKLVTKMATKFVDQLEATLQAGHVNGGMRVTGDGPFTLVAGGIVADGMELEKLLKELVALAESEPEFPPVKLNAEKHAGVNFHTVSMPLPPQADAAARKVLGDPLKIAFGFGANSAFVAVGPDASDEIKAILDGSADTADPSLPPLQMSLSLGPVLKFAAEQEGGNPMLSMLAGAIEDSDKDHLLMTVSETENGSSFRILAEEGLLKLLGSAARMGQAAALGR